MSANGRTNGAAHGQALVWPRRVLSFADVRHSVNGHGELRLDSAAVVTPLAEEELRANGVRVVRGTPTVANATKTWGHGRDRAYPLVHSAITALTREGISLREWAACEGLLCRWTRAIAECVSAGECAGGVLFCGDPGLACCVANKVAGLRAVPVTTVQQAARATLTLAANLIVVEMPGRTFFEIRQILRTLTEANRDCPDGVACTLRELEGHANR